MKAATLMPTSTQNAQAVPDVNACGKYVLPCVRIRLLKWVSETDEQTAMPTAPPICCAVLIRPEASHASSWLTPPCAAIEIGMIANGIANPMIR